VPQARGSVLVVVDEPTTVQIISSHLDQAGYATSSSADGHEAVAVINAEKPDLVILDVVLPGLDGLQVMDRIRRREHTAVILVGGESADPVIGLRLGADDHLSKPIVPAELVARVQAVLRRRDHQPLQSVIAAHGLDIDTRARRVTVRSEPVHLTPMEFDLLAFLARHPHRVFSRAELLELVWGWRPYIESSTVAVHVRRLRTKVEADPSRPTRLKTVWGAGYRFDP
jgi:DNA-binding response OmpR family regulator